MTHDPHRDRYGGPPITNPPPYSRDRHSGLLWATVAIGLLVAIGLGFWGSGQRSDTTANPPAVTAAPAPATGTGAASRRDNGTAGATRSIIHCQSDARPV